MRIGFGFSLAAPMAAALILAQPDPVISFSGSGYAGSVYTSTVAAQWTADGTAISGATGTTWTMTSALEGKVIRCGASNAIQMWTPKALAVIDLWSDPSDATKVTLANANIYSIAPKAGIVTDAMVQATVAYQPALQQLNGLNCGYYTFGNSGLYAAFTNTFDRLGSSAFAVVTAEVPSNQSSTMFAMGTSSSGGFRADVAINTFASPAIRCNLSSDFNSDLSYPTGDATGHLIGYHCDPATPSSVKTNLDGVLSGTSGGAATGKPTSLWLGGFSALPGRWQGKIAEVLYVPGITAAQRQLCEGYLMQKWGLSSKLAANHPYKSAAPRLQ